MDRDPCPKGRGLAPDSHVAFAYSSAEVSRFAHNKALHYLARAGEYRLSEPIRQQLIEVVHAATGGSDDEDAARRGIEWMRRQDRVKGERPTF
jgi:hypothetical protein